MKRPIGRYLQLDLELMVVHQIGCYDLIHRACNLDSKIIVNQKSSRFRALDVSQLGLYDYRREILGCVVGDG
jgi:hypothetical protein